MEVHEVNIEPIKKILKCKEGEFLFATYDSSKDADASSEIIQEMLAYCQENGCQCLFLPETDDQVSVALQDFNAEQLRKLEKLVHEALMKKSKIILN